MHGDLPMNHKKQWPNLQFRSFFAKRSCRIHRCLELNDTGLWEVSSTLYSSKPSGPLCKVDIVNSHTTIYHKLARLYCRVEKKHWSNENKMSLAQDVYTKQVVSAHILKNSSGSTSILTFQLEICNHQHTLLKRKPNIRNVFFKYTC